MSVLNRIKGLGSQRLTFSVVAIVLNLVLSGGALADEIRPAYLQLTEKTDQVIDVHWKVPARGMNQRLALDVVFDDQTEAVTSPTEAFLNGSNTRFWSIKRDQGLTGLTLAVDGLARTNTEVLTRIEYLDGSSVTHRLTPDAPDYHIAAKPTWAETAVTYFVLGVEHILLGPDHLLFVFVLLLLVRNMKRLIVTITAFTVAHSITLISAALGLVSIPVPPMEACIALSIVFVATEIIRGQQGKPGLTERRPWIVAFAFGLLHGLGFAAALGEIGLPQNAIPVALVLFNVGVEVGQILFVCVVVLVWEGIKRLPVTMPEWLIRVPAYTIGIMASFWVFERVASFWV